MYQKVHKRLTFVFTGITSLVLIAMSVSFLYLSEQTLRKNSFLSFSEEMDTFVSSLGQQTTISCEWLSKMSGNGKYLIASYDHGVPLSYTSVALSREAQSLMDEVAKNCADALRFAPSADSFPSVHKEFAYTADDRNNYYVCFARIRHSKKIGGWHMPLAGYADGGLTAIILCPTKELSNQLMASRIHFLVMNLIGALLLLLFSWRYTKRLLSPIQESQARQTAFIAAASHELRTPLSVILSSASALKCASPAEEGRFLHTIENESRRMSRLVTDMLTLARSDSHAWSFRLKEAELDTVLLNACEAFLPLASQKKISLFVELPNDALPPCLCDQERISQALGIFISNAISYGNTGGYVKLTLAFQSGMFRFQVIDNGIGIPKEAKEHIFDRFYRADVSRSKKEHFGLGLCIAKEIIKAHHGSIQVADTPGGGATFTVQLHKSTKLAP